MGFTKRQKNIIEILMAGEFISAASIAKKMQLSEKTVRVDIGIINAQYEQPVIRSFKGKGYKLNEDYVPEAEDVHDNTGDKRQVALLLRVMLGDQPDFYELADEFFISESTLEKDIKIINKWISKRYDDILISKKSSQILVSGAEERRRSVFVYFLLKEIEEYNFSFDQFTGYFITVDLLSLKQLVLEYLKEEQLQLGDKEIVLLILHLAVLLERAGGGHPVSDIKDEDSLPTEPGVLHLCSKIEDFSGFMLPDPEKVYLNRLFVNKVKPDTEEILEEDIYQEFLTGALEDVYQDYNVDLRADEDFKVKLLAHLKDLYHRAKTQQYVDNPFIADIKQSYPLVYDISVYLSLKIQDYFDVRLHEDEIAYISLHLATTIESRQSRQKRIVLVNPKGASVTRYIEKKLNYYFKHTIVIVRNYSVFEIEELKNEEADLVITTVPLYKNAGCPVFQCSNLINNDELEKIRKLLTNQEFDKLEARLALLKQFDSSLFFPLLDVKTREEAIRFLCDQMVKQGYCDQSYVDYVMEREQIASTSFGNYIAIPHPVKMAAFKNGIAVATFRDDILWGENKVRVVFLFSLRSRSNNLTLFYEALVRSLDDPGRMKNIIEYTEFNRFIESFLQ